ncbi:MAG: hypothetical protein QF357_08130 [Dehalococcoidia bacterium]|jgi:hypothetical protein|nr:hypothetical protein [Dehalococcoidia bacterium]
MSDTDERPPRSLLEAVFRRSGLPWHLAALVVGLILVGLAVGALALDGNLVDTDLTEWRWALMSPVLITYLLIVEPALSRLKDRADAALEALPHSGADAPATPAARRRVMTVRGELIALAVGLAIGVALYNPWEPGELNSWSTGLRVAALGIVTFGLMAQFVYLGIASTASFSRLLSRPVDIDLFRPWLLYPVGLWSLAVSLCLIGGGTIAAIVQPNDEWDLDFFIAIGAVTLSAAAVFYLGLKATHNVMAHAKQKEADLTLQQLNGLTLDLKRMAATGDHARMQQVSSAMSAWAVHERRLQGVPTWPYNMAILRRLLVSLPLPLAAAGGKVLVASGLF